MKLPPEAKLAKELTLTGGGRKGRVELISVCRRLALEEGDSLESMLYRVTKGVAYWAEKGDAACAKLIFQLFAKDEPAEVTPQIEAKDAEVGPPPPKDPAAYAAHAARVLKEIEDI